MDAKTLTREERRQRMPETAAVFAEFAAEFGEVTLEYAEEGGYVWGKREPDGYVVKGSEMEFWHALQRQKDAEKERDRVGTKKSRSGR